MTDEKELNKKLAEWAGFIYDEGAEYIGGGGNNNQLLYGLWYPPSNDHVGSPNPPNFTQSLDACFKWLVPKLFGLHYSVIIAQTLAQATTYIRPLEIGKQFDAVDNHNPALALCLAIEKLIDGEKGG